MKGMSVSIYKNTEFGDCSNNGVSKFAKSAYIVGPGVPEILTITDTVEKPVLVLHKRNVRSGSALYPLRLCVLDADGNLTFDLSGKPVLTRWCMFGGNYACTSDSRWGELLGSSMPIAIHDRVE